MQVKSMGVGGGEGFAPAAETEGDALRRLAERLPRPVRFLLVGALGLITDVGIFTLVMNAGVPPLIARLVSLSLATLVTWRLNRALTFERSGRRQHREAMRYVAVTAAAQTTSYVIFAILTLTVLAGLPQAGIVIGAACGALISYNGHRLFAFAPAPAKPTTQQADGARS